MNSNHVTSWTRAAACLLPAILFVSYALFLAAHVGAHAGGADSSGYLNQARLLAAGEVALPMRTVGNLTPADLGSDEAYVPLGFRPRPSHEEEMVPLYPTGMSLLQAGASTLIGWRLGPDVVMVGHALAGVLLVYALGRHWGLRAIWAIVAAGSLALSPLYLFTSLQSMSDTVALVWVTATVLTASLAARAHDAIRPRAAGAWALTAGLGCALAVLVRPTNILVVLPVAVLFGSRWRLWLLFGAGGAPGALFLGLYNLAVYGQAFTTGYGDNSYLFSGEWLVPTLWHYVRWGPVALTLLIAAALATPWLRTLSRRDNAVAGIWAVGFLAFYAFYFHTHETWWYLRFILPAAPPLLLLAAGALQAWVDRHRPQRFLSRGPRLAAAGLLVGLSTYTAFHWGNRWGVTQTGANERIYPRTIDWLTANLPDGAVLLGMQVSGAALYYSDFPLVRWDMITPGSFARLLEVCGAEGRPVYAPLFPFEVAHERLTALGLPQWEVVHEVGHVRIYRVGPRD